MTINVDYGVSYFCSAYGLYSLWVAFVLGIGLCFIIGVSPMIFLLPLQSEKSAV